jgi:hypothetical protein
MLANASALKDADKELHRPPEGRGGDLDRFRQGMAAGEATAEEIS